MKRMMMIGGLFLGVLLLTSSFWAGLTGAGAAEDSNVKGDAAPPAQITPFPFAPAVGPSQLATAAARLEADAVVIFDNLNMRSGPGLGYRILDKYADGTLLDVLGQGRDGDNKPWLYVRTPDGKKGWMSARPGFNTTKYLQINMPVSDIPFLIPPTPTPDPVDGYVDIEDLNMRAGPGLGYSKIGKYNKGTPLNILGQKLDGDGMPWLYVQTPDGKKGYMSARPNLSSTPYVEIKIPHSQIPSLGEQAAEIDLEPVELDTTQFAPFSPAGAELTIVSLGTLSCSDLCQWRPPAISHSAGDRVCLQWYEWGGSRAGDMIDITVEMDGREVASTSIDAIGGGFCKAIGMKLDSPGKYRAVVTANKESKDIEWIVE